MNEMCNLILETTKLACRNAKKLNKLERRLLMNELRTQMAFIGLLWIATSEWCEIQKLKDAKEK